MSENNENNQNQENNPEEVKAKVELSADNTKIEPEIKPKVETKPEVKEEIKEEKPKNEEPKVKKRRKNKSILHIPESKKRKEPTRKDGRTYIVPKRERKIFHLEVEELQFDSKTGKKISNPHIQKLDGLKAYQQFVKGAMQSKLDYSILHDPRPYFPMSKEEIKAMDKKLKSGK